MRRTFETEQLVICSLDFLRKKRRRFEQVLETEWDLLVVDEAHHLEWSEEAPAAPNTKWWKRWPNRCQACCC